MKKLTDKQVADFVKSLSKEEQEALNKAGTEMIQKNTKDLANYQNQLNEKLNKFIELKLSK